MARAVGGGWSEQDDLVEDHPYQPGGYGDGCGFVYPTSDQQCGAPKAEHLTYAVTPATVNWPDPVDHDPPSGEGFRVDGPATLVSGDGEVLAEVPPPPPPPPVPFPPRRGVPLVAAREELCGRCRVLHVVFEVPVGS